MSIYLIIIFFSTFYLLTINFLLKKFDICLDKATINESHKSLLRFENSVPLSGTIYFLPVVLTLFYKFELEVIIVCSLFFILGLLSDLKSLSSYKLRLLIQISLLIFLFIINKELEIYTRLKLIDNLMIYDFPRIIICTFFFMVLINGYNLIDGTNCLCTLNFLIILLFIYFTIHKMNIDFISYEINFLIIFIAIFLILNFFGLNFLGDGAAYGIGFLIGYILVKISLIDQSISPYYIANLLWYPAFENLFSILRRTFKSNNNYLPDNDHLHHLIYKFFIKKKYFLKNFLQSSIVGILINFVLLFSYLIGYLYLTNTVIQSILIFIGVSLYLTAYYSLAKKLN